MVNVDRKTKRNPTFTGGYIQGGYMLTDDARNYNAYFAQFWRLKPKRSIMEGGIGAWEVAARASTMDLNDTDIKWWRSFILYYWFKLVHDFVY